MPGANLSSKGNDKVTVAALSDGVKIVVDFAKSALESEKFDFPTFEKLALLVRQHLKSSSSRAGPLMTHDTQSSYLVFGEWVHGGLFGITKKTLSHSRLCIRRLRHLLTNRPQKGLFGLRSSSTSMEKHDSRRISTI